MKSGNMEIIMRSALAIIIGGLFAYLILSMSGFGDTYDEKQTANIEQIIDKALVQCYALEGGYPSEVEYVEKYGVIFDNEKYIYHYEWYGSNLRPMIAVIER